MWEDIRDRLRTYFKLPACWPLSFTRNSSNCVDFMGAKAGAPRVPCILMSCAAIALRELDVPILNGVRFVQIFFN